LDEIVLTNLKQRVLAPDRIADLLKSLIERQSAKIESADRGLLDLQRELSDAEDRLMRLYRSIEDGIVELDDILKERTATLKSQRERAKAALDHARAQSGTAAAIDAGKIDAFARLMNGKLDTAEANTRKGYIRSIIDAVEVDETAIRIVGSKDILQAAIAGKQIENGNVRGFVRKWRLRRVSNACPPDASPRRPGFVSSGARKAPDFLASGENPAIYRAISHGNMAQKAVRWQPGRKARLLTRFRRNQPEN
jgi:site-specific DNA recombinase